MFRGVLVIRTGRRGETISYSGIRVSHNLVLSHGDLVADCDGIQKYWVVSDIESKSRQLKERSHEISVRSSEIKEIKNPLLTDSENPSQASVLIGEQKSGGFTAGSGKERPARIILVWHSRGLERQVNRLLSDWSSTDPEEPPPRQTICSFVMLELIDGGTDTIQIRGSEMSLQQTEATYTVNDIGDCANIPSQSKFPSEVQKSSPFSLWAYLRSPCNTFFSGSSQPKKPFHSPWQVLKELESLRWPAIRQGNIVMVESTPFGPPLWEAGRLPPLLNSWSRGIVSNLSEELLLLDAPCLPGSEGAPVYKYRAGGHRQLCGIVVAPLCWRRGEWVGLTLAADLGRLLTDLVRQLGLQSQGGQSLRQVSRGPIAAVDTRRVTIRASVILIHTSASWGSGVIIDGRRGIILTCAHVVRPAKDGVVSVVTLDGREMVGSVCFLTPEKAQLDVAVLQVSNTSAAPLCSLPILTRLLKPGEEVLAVGHALFDHTSRLPPTVTSGVVSQVTSRAYVTTCWVHGGSSGGALVSSCGSLAGIIISNTLDEESGGLNPRFSWILPTSLLWGAITAYLSSGDVAALESLNRPVLPSKL